MKRAFSISAVCALAVVLIAAKPAHISKVPDKPLPGEVSFVQSVQNDLMARFPRASDAEKAGYFRFSNEDSTGSISYANLHWTSADPQHPSQLWYDVKGNLLGADFSRPLTKQRPNLWGIDPRRWDTFEQHVHYILKLPDGAMKYGLGAEAPEFKKAGGNPSDPQVATLVKMHKVKNPSQVVKIFEYPAIWDLMVWVKPNPNGAFAYKNPLVHPTKGHHGMM